MILSSLVVPHILTDFCNLRVLKLRCPKGQEGEAIREEGGVECTCVYCVNGGDQCWTGEHSSLKTVEGKQVPSAHEPKSLQLLFFLPSHSIKLDDFYCDNSPRVSGLILSKFLITMKLDAL